MTRAEFGEHILRRLNGYWPHSPLPKDTMALVFETLKDISVELAHAGLESLHREGKEFAPTAGMILKRTVELQVDPPEWADAAKELAKCLAYGERVFYGGEFHDERAKRLEEAPLALREFVAS